jgi:hypothetical protein
VPKIQTNPFTYSTYAHSVGALLHEPSKAFLSDAPSAALPATGGQVSHTKENILFKVSSTEILRAQRASSTVSGELDNGHFTSVATSTVEKLNIRDRITADAVVGKVTSLFPSTPAQKAGLDPALHPAKFYTGGSYFVNLKIDGTPYTFTTHSKYSDDNGFSIPKADRLPPECLFTDPAKGIYIPEFGTIYLGEVVIYRSKIILTMLRVEFDSPTSGTTTVATSSTNGIDG